MAVGTILKSSGWAAIAVALATSAISGEAQARPEPTEEGQAGDVDRPSNGYEARGRQVQRSNEQRAEQRAQRTEQRAEQQAQRIDRRSEQRAAQVEHRGDQLADQAARRSSWQAARQADRSSEQAARQIEQRGDDAARQVEQRAQWRTEQTQRADRNRSYSDRDRNRSYARDERRDDDRRGDGNWQGDRRGSDSWARSDGRGDYRRWDRNWRGNDRYDWRRYRDNHRHVYNLSTYYSPYRYYTYRRFGVGSHLNSQFFGSSYWITNPWQYRLPEVWGPYRWVRYYDDVMLVDIYTGQVVDVIYNFFW